VTVPPVRILGVVGSLRRASANSAIVHAAVQLARRPVTVEVFTGLADLPPFNPDLESLPLLSSVAHWRMSLAAADALLISSPEYAHGVPGVLKNAFDWVVGSGEIMHKPIALVNASSLSTFVTEQLRETLSVMMGTVLVATALPLTGRPQTANELLGQPLATEALANVLDLLTSHCASRASAV
jgi:chromate reductase